MTDIEKLTQHLMSVDMYAAKLLIAGRPKTNRTVRNQVEAIQAGTLTPEAAGFTPHIICGKVFIEDLSVAPKGKPVKFK